MLLTVGLLEGSLEQHAGHVNGNGRRGFNGDSLSIGWHEAVDTKLLHDLLTEELHLGRLSVHQHHVLGLCLVSERVSVCVCGVCVCVCVCVCVRVCACML